MAFDLVEDQIERFKVEGLKLGTKGAKIDMILLAGGLGTSSYVWQQFSSFCDKNLKGKCELLTDPQAWSAPVRGAAIRGQNGNLVLSKKAKRMLWCRRASRIPRGR